MSPSDIFQKMVLVEKYFQICQACFGCSECEWVNVEAFGTYAFAEIATLTLQAQKTCQVYISFDILLLNVDPDYMKSSIAFSFRVVG